MPDTTARVNNWKILGRHILTSLSSIVLAFVLIWNVSKPHAQDFIRDTVRQENFASKNSLDAISQKLLDLETRIGQVESGQRTQQNAQTRLETALNSVEELQKEQRQDIKEILKGIKSLNN